MREKQKNKKTIDKTESKSMKTLSNHSVFLYLHTHTHTIKHPQELETERVNGA